MGKDVQTANTSKTVLQLLDYVNQGQLVLPEIQRDFVWSRKAIKRLFDSLFRELPIGNLLIWNTKTEQQVIVKSFKGQKKGHQKGRPGYGYLLDGQQRLTAIERVRDRDDDYPLMFYAWPNRKADDDEPFYWRGGNEEDYPWCIPVSDILNSDFKPGDVINALKSDEEYLPEHEELVRADLDRVKSILNYSVGITEFETDDSSLATELFIRFNSTGTKLRSTDLLWPSSRNTYLS